MLNEPYILSLINPYLNSKRELSEFEFLELFSELTQKEQYEVVNIMIKNDIDYVDEKEEETKSLEKIEVLGNSPVNKDFKKMMNLSNEQLCVMYQEGDNAALEALIEKNKRFVYQKAVKIFNEYRQNSLTVDDLYIEGNLGLIEAAKKFDVSKGYLFLTYAWYWIRQKLVRSTVDTGFLIRLPVHMYDKMIKVNNCRKRHPDANVNEIQRLLAIEDDFDIEIEKIEELIMYSELYMNTASLNDVVGEGEDTERIMLIPDDSIQVDEIVMGKELKTKIRSLLATLTERERNVLDLRFGLSSGRSMTLEAVGEKYHITRERVRQIEAKALRKLRHPSRARYVKDFCD